MRGGHSEVGKVDLGPYLCEKDDSCLKKRYTSPLNSSPHLNPADSGIRRGGTPGKPRLRRASLWILGVNIKPLIGQGGWESE